MKTIILFCAVACTLAAQDATSASDANVTRGVSAIGQFFDHDFINFYAYGNGTWDSKVPQVNSTGITTYSSGLGWNAGGGVTAVRTFKDGGLTVNYRGGYRDSEGVGSFGSGTDQSLALGYSKRFNRHWTMNLSANGGILAYGTSYYSAVSAVSTTPGNPGSLESRFANVGLSMTYQQTRRLSYVVSGNFLYNGYGHGSSPNQTAYSAISTHGLTGSASVLYRLTARTTIGGSFTHTYYQYTGNSGSASVDGGALTLSHQFQYHWQIDLSGGINHSNASGRALTFVPVQFLGQTVYAECYCAYNRVVNSPSYQVSLSHFYRHSSVSLSGGQSILGGNGLLLTSRDQFANGTYSYSTRRTNISLGGNWSRLSSVSTSAGGITYGYWGGSGSVGYNLFRYVSANGRYDWIHYNKLYGSMDLNENRISFGLSLSTKSVPLTLF